MHSEELDSDRVSYEFSTAVKLSPKQPTRRITGSSGDENNAAWRNECEEQERLRLLSWREGMKKRGGLAMGKGWHY
jgi:hypothetical protein